MVDGCAVVIISCGWLYSLTHLKCFLLTGDAFKCVDGCGLSVGESVFCVPLGSPELARKSQTVSLKKDGSLRI